MSTLANKDTTTLDPATVRADFSAARRSGLRAKDAAASLGLSEGAVVAAHVGAHDLPLKAVRLQGPWVDVLQALEACGTVMALTRNESTVHEKDGVYRNVSVNGHVGLALDPLIDLRLFFTQWHAGFAVQEAAANAGQLPSQSLQFFNASGLAVHKIFAREATDRAAWAALVERFTDAQAAPASFGPAAPRKPIKDDSEIDADALATDWAAMKDTHEFFLLLQRHGAERQQGLRLVEGRFAWRASNEAVQGLLDEAAMDGTPIMVFVGSAGCIQIHTGPVHNIKPMEMGGQQWTNVLDPGFNLHLRTDMINSVWVVEKPTEDGIVTSVEAFDHSGELMVMFFGERKPGNPELGTWRDLVARLPRLDAVPA